MFSFVFWRKLKTAKWHFEINWPLNHVVLCLHHQVYVLAYLSWITTMNLFNLSTRGRVSWTLTLTRGPDLTINRSWRLSTTPNTIKKILIIFKLIQQFIMVILSCLAKKKSKFEIEKKNSVYYWKLHFHGGNACKLPFLVINWTFFSSNTGFGFSLPDNSEWS